MRLKEELSTNPKSVRGNVSSVEIPKHFNIDDKKVRKNVTGDDSNENEDDYSDLLITNGLQNLRLVDSFSAISGQSDVEESDGSNDDDDDDDDDDEDISPELVAKSPSRNKDQLKAKLQSDISPYPKTQQRSIYLYNNNTIGDVTVDVTHRFPQQNKLPADNDCNIPVTVSEFNAPDVSLEDLIDSITDDQYEELARLNEIATQQQTDNVTNVSSRNDYHLTSTTGTISSPPLPPRPATRTRTPSSSSCSSSVAAASPQSNPTPIPKKMIPPTGDAKTTTIINTPPESDMFLTNSPTDSSYWTMPNSPASTNSNSPNPQLQMNISRDDTSSLSSSGFENPNEYLLDKETINKWVLPTLPTFNIPTPTTSLVINQAAAISENKIKVNLLPLTVAQHKTTTAINNLGGDLTLPYPEPPTTCYVLPGMKKLTASFQQIQDTTHQSQPLNNFERHFQNSLPPSYEEPEEFINLFPLKPSTFTARSLINIKPGGITVSEINLNVSGADRLKKCLNAREKEIAWVVVCLEKEADINSINEQNQTKLMQILHQGPTKQFLEKIFTRVQRIKKEKRKTLLQQKDIHGHNALYIAAMLNNNNPLLARFIADTYVELNIDPDELYGESGNSLLHIIASEGDNYAQVLAELLSVAQQTGTKAFNINRLNKKLLTPLHVAAQTHSPNISTLAITQLFVKHGAQLALQDNNGNTCLHTAIDVHSDPMYVKALLQSTNASQCINLVNTNGDTALHIISSKNNIPLNRQKEVINQLITSGASHNIHNRNGKLALTMVSPDRKQDMKNLFNKKSFNNTKYFVNARI